MYMHHRTLSSRSSLGGKQVVIMFGLASETRLPLTISLSSGTQLPSPFSYLLITSTFSEPNYNSIMCRFVTPNEILAKAVSKPSFIVRSDSALAELDWASVKWGPPFGSKPLIYGVSDTGWMTTEVFAEVARKNCERIRETIPLSQRIVVYLDVAVVHISPATSQMFKDLNFSVYFLVARATGKIQVFFSSSFSCFEIFAGFVLINWSRFAILISTMSFRRKSEHLSRSMSTRS